MFPHPDAGTSLPPEAAMDKGVFAESGGENREPLFFEISEPETLAPRPPSGPPEPVLLFKPPEPNRVVRGARALLSSGTGRISEGAKRLHGPGTGVARISEPETSLSTVRDGRPWSMEERRPGSSITLLTRLVAAACAAVWAVVGAVFWLPVVLGSILHFGVAHLQAMLDGRVPHEAGAGLRSAASFYMRGFAAALDVARPMAAGSSGGRLSSFADKDPIQKGRLLGATGWAFVSWYAALFIVGALDWPHLELWNLLSEGAVADLASSLGSDMAAVLADLTGAAARRSTELIPGS